MENNKERIEKILALLLLNSANLKTMADKALQLNIAGFSNIEIADLLQTTQGVIGQLLYTKRKTKKN